MGPYMQRCENVGSGGRIETSGHSLEVDNIKISTKSVNGKDGEWLLDPYNIEIVEVEVELITRLMKMMSNKCKYISNSTG